MIEAEQWMTAALAQARRALGPCHPNPAVGALVVHRGCIVATGYTQPPGGPHAEVEALARFVEQKIRPDATTTLVVTLEPCCTHGRTPPCTSAIIASGIGRVVVGTTDPNPAHAGKGFDILREGGIVVEAGVLETACADLNLSFHHWMETNQPLFAAKIATTIDGRVATRTGHSKWITGEASRANVARWRRAFPAIAVGAGTVLADNPQLTSRLSGEDDWCPRRLIFDRGGRCLAKPKQSVFTDADASRTIYLSTADHLKSMPPAWMAAGVQGWVWTGWEALAERCLTEGITGVYFEGGPGLLSDLIAAQKLDYLFAYRAPSFLADALAPGPFDGQLSTQMEVALQLRDVRHESFGDDQLMRGFVVYSS